MDARENVGGDSAVRNCADVGAGLLALAPWGYRVRRPGSVPTLDAMGAYIEPVSDADAARYEAFIPKRTRNYEDSFDHIRLYFDSGRRRAYRYFDGANLVFFCRWGHAPHYRSNRPRGPEAVPIAKQLVRYLYHFTDQPVWVRNVRGDALASYAPVRTRRFQQLIFDIRPYGGELEAALAGSALKKVREKVRRLQRHHPAIRCVLLEPALVMPSIHFIAQWRKDRLGADAHAYLDVEKSKDAVRYYGSSDGADRAGREHWAYVFLDEGRVVALECLYRLGTDAAAHTVGLADRRYRGLSEYAQVVAWHHVARDGIAFVNDGPSWVASVARYKMKFRPVDAQIVYDCLPGVE